MMRVEALGLDLLLRDGPMRQIVQPALDDITLSLGTGEILAVAGQSGAGKSLLAHAMLGLYPPGGRLRGRFWLGGVEMDAAALAAARGRRIALAPQSTGFLDPLASTGRQIEWAARRAGSGRSAARAGVVPALARLGLPAETAMAYPHELSVGMARRVLLAIATIGDPALLVVDEPTAGLDDANATLVETHLRAIAARGTAILAITHDLPLAARLASRIAFVRDGRLVGIETLAGPQCALPYARAMFSALPYARAMFSALPQNRFDADA